MKKEESYALLVAFIVAIVIFIGSSMVFPSLEGAQGLNLKSTAYHFSIFFFFTAFLLVALAPKGNHSNVVFVIVFSFLYSVSDEIHQVFVPGRAFSFTDIFIDLCGILLASLLYAVFTYWQKNQKT
ncbi:VanZ family protein [Candidatus Pacearchaeota archaeon]|nr:VanZ family protein [Candidatus Pacearchaeota archaeon]